VFAITAELESELQLDKETQYMLSILTDASNIIYYLVNAIVRKILHPLLLSPPFLALC
jgi:hypothetical protein